MSRRVSAPWAATSTPDLHRRFLEGDLHVEGIKAWRQKLTDMEAAGASAAQTKPLTDMLAKDYYARAQLASAQLYWVTREMTLFALEAAFTLPEWTPRAAMPAESGLLCWARPVGGLQVVVRGMPAVVDNDAMAWYIRKDGMLEILACSRFGRTSAGARKAKIMGLDQPFLCATAGVTDPDQPVKVDHVDPDEAPALSVLGAAWLLMSQPAVAQSRQVGDLAGATKHALPRKPDLLTAPVTMIDLRRIVERAADDGTDPSASKGRTYSRRWWVKAHWRQQAVGPGRSHRKPVLILPHIKGPEGTPLTNDRVHVWRR